MYAQFHISNAHFAQGHSNHFNLIRMIAASGVLVSHAYPIALGTGAVQPLQPIIGHSLGWVCVAVFFAVSGFFITRSFAENPNWQRFLTARALRLFPALFVVLLVTVLAAAFLTTATAETYWRAGPGYILRNLTLFRLDYDLPGVFMSNPGGPAINGSLWTLFYEVVCYLGVFAAGLLGLLTRPALFGGLLVLVIAGAAVAVHFDLPWRLGTLGGLALPFAIGAGVYTFRDRIPMSPILALGLAALAALAHGTALFDLALITALSYGTIFLGFCQMPTLLSYNRLGDYSYGMYIYAFPVQQLVVHWGVSGPLANIALALPITLACAVASWHLVEAPALRLKPRARAAIATS